METWKQLNWSFPKTTLRKLESLSGQKTAEAVSGAGWLQLKLNGSDS